MSVTDRDVSGPSNDKTGRTYAPMHTCILRSPALSPHAKILYGCLVGEVSDHDGMVDPARETLAGYLGKSVDRVDVYLGELKQAGLIRITRRGLGRNNAYAILAPNAWTNTGLIAAAKADHIEVRHAD